jgi:type IV pilus assembly protein PilW
MRYASTRRAQAGLSLVEIMVATVISLVATIVIFQTFAVSEGVRRTSASGGDAQQNGALALYSIGRELRMAGFGINNDLLLGCEVHAYDTEHAPNDIPVYTLAPVVIVPGAAATDSDTLTINYGNADLLANPAQLTQDMAGPTSLLRVSNRYGYRPSDTVLLAEAGVDPDGDGRPDCVLAEITSTPEAAGQTDEVHHGTGAYLDNEGTNHVVRFNKAGGQGITYTKEARIFNLGAAPIQALYRVANNQLVLDSTYGTVASRVIADNIVQMRVEYGKDDGANNGTVASSPFIADDGIVDNYVNTMPVNPTMQDWKRIVAVRLAVVARSALAEKPAVDGGACDTTAAAPTWSGGAFDLTGDANWNCYRYRVFETTVPLRNIIWQQL